MSFCYVFNRLNNANQRGKAILEDETNNEKKSSQVRKQTLLKGPAGTKKRYNKKPFDVLAVHFLRKSSVFIVN